MCRTQLRSQQRHGTCTLCNTGSCKYGHRILLGVLSGRSAHMAEIFYAAAEYFKPSTNHSQRDQIAVLTLGSSSCLLLTFPVQVPPGVSDGRGWVTVNRPTRPDRDPARLINRRACALRFTLTRHISSIWFRQSGFGAPANLADWPRQGSNPGAVLTLGSSSCLLLTFPVQVYHS